MPRNKPKRAATEVREAQVVSEMLKEIQTELNQTKEIQYCVAAAKPLLEQINSWHKKGCPKLPKRTGSVLFSFFVEATFFAPLIFSCKSTFHEEGMISLTEDCFGLVQGYPGELFYVQMGNNCSTEPKKVDLRFLFGKTVKAGFPSDLILTELKRWASVMELWPAD